MPKRTKGNGRVAWAVLRELTAALDFNYPGIEVSPDDLWFQKGDYIKKTWDLARWGSETPYWLKGVGEITVKTHTWFTMAQCAKGVCLSKPAFDLPHNFELFPK